MISFSFLPLTVFLLGCLVLANAQKGLLPSRLKESTLYDSARRLVKLKVKVNSKGQATDAGLTLAGCLRDPPLARFLYNHFSGVDACEYCMTTVGKCSKRGENIIPIFIDDVLQYRGYRLVVTNSIPNHEYQSNNTCEYYKAMLLPLYTRVPRQESNRKFKKQPKGTVGIAVTGGLIVNDLSNEGRCGILKTLEEDETGKFNHDSCDGHSVITNCQYHYHSTPVCALPFNSEAHCKRVGFMHDGISIYSFCTVRFQKSGQILRMSSCYRKPADNYGCYPDDWKYTPGSSGLSDFTQCNLDKANGYLFEEDAVSLDGNTNFFKGVYYYFYTEEFPYTPLFYTGENPGYTSNEALCGLSPTNFRYQQPNEFYQRLCVRGKAYGPDQPIYIIEDPPQIVPKKPPTPQPTKAPSNKGKDKGKGGISTGTGTNTGEKIVDPKGIDTFELLTGGSSTNLENQKNTADVVRRILISENEGTSG